MSCLGGGFWGTEIHDKGFADAGQGERVRVPLADGTRVSLPGGKPDPAMLPDLLTLTDVMCTGHHAARAGRVAPGSTVAVIGDGAVGLCAIIAAKRLGAARIVAMSRHESRRKLAVEFGATDVVAERGTDGIEKLNQMFGGVGPDAVLECVGTRESMETAVRAVRPAGKVGYVGAPAGGSALDMATMYFNNVGVDGGIAFVRDYMPELLPDILNGTIEPGKVLDLELPLAEVPDAYQAMEERRAIKVMLRSDA